LTAQKEGWPILIGIRLSGLLTLGSTMAWLSKPALFGWASHPMPVGARWIGVAALACTVAWLIWMFHTLGRNLTDTVVTRRDAHFVDHGPYRFVRNPMYTGILMAGMSFGLALGTWLISCRGKPHVLAVGAPYADRGTIPDRALRRSVSRLYEARRPLSPKAAGLKICHDLTTFPVALQACHLRRSSTGRVADQSPADGRSGL
jgi:hypothetical protein